MSECLRVAIVGCGKVADAHANAILSLPNTRLVGVCDSELLMAEQLSMRFGNVPLYDDMDQLIEREHPDLLHIATPPQSHLDLARRAFSAGCHVFLEKPAALNTREVRDLLDAARASGKLLSVNYQYLFDRAAVHLRKLVAGHFLGDVVHIESMYGYDLTGAYGSAVLQNCGHWAHALPGKLLQNVIDHLINKIVDLVPDLVPVRICAWGKSRSERARANPSGELVDELRVLLDFGETTAYATFSSGIRPVGHFVRVCGTKRTATLNLGSSTILFDAAPKLPGALGRLTPPLQGGLAGIRAGLANVGRFVRSDFHFNYGLNTLLSSFYASIRTGASPPIAYEHILQVSSIMEEIFTQLRCEDEGSSDRGGRISRHGGRAAPMGTAARFAPMPGPKQDSTSIARH